MNVFEILSKLCAAPGVSGAEQNVATAAKELLSNYSSDVWQDGFSVIARIGPENAKKNIMLDAHIDQIGFVVTSIKDGGFLTIASCGGVDPRLMPAQRLLVHGKETISAVVCSTPPHLSDGSGKVLEISELFIDTGLSKEKLSEIVSLGDVVSYDSPLIQLKNGRVSGAALDDRAGMAAILFALEQISSQSLENISVTVLFSEQEEVSMRGAKIQSFAHTPDKAIIVDVTHAKSVAESKAQNELSKGVAIGIAPILAKNLGKNLADIAKTHDIPFQYEVMSGSTGTNADGISITRGGVSCAVLSIPLTYMHTTVELIDMADVESTGRLIAAYLMEENNHE